MCFCVSLCMCTYITICALVFQLTELSADLSEEHTTSSHATEIIEQETSNRLRLEKDLRDIQVCELISSPIKKVFN